MREWIDCSERLPDDSYDGVAVIVATVTSQSPEVLISEADTWNKQRRSFDFWGSRVAYWMPLPAPPQD